MLTANQVRLLRAAKNVYVWLDVGPGDTDGLRAKDVLRDAIEAVEADETAHWQRCVEMQERKMSARR